MKITDNILSFEDARKKKTSPSVTAVKIICTLEELLEDCPTEAYVSTLKKFMSEVNLGPKPLTGLARICQGSSHLFGIMIALLEDLPVEAYALLLDYAEKRYPKDLVAIKRFQTVLSTFVVRNLSLEQFESLFPKGKSWILNYILGHDDTFEQYALNTDGNIIHFPED